MNTVYRILRSLLIVAICVAVVSPLVLYVALSLPSVQSRVARQCETSLSQLLGCEVAVGDLGIVPFNRVVLRNVAVVTAPGDTALTVRRLGAGIRLMSLFGDEPLTINYVELVGMDARLRRDSVGAPLNIQPIIDALSPKKERREPSGLDLRINTVMIRSSRLAYDVGADLPSASDGDRRFSPSHIAVDRLRADVRIPRLRENDFKIEVKRMDFVESVSGFVLDNLAGSVAVSPAMLAVNGLHVELPGSDFRLKDMEIPLKGGVSKLKDNLSGGSFSVGITSGSTLTLGDVAPFVPVLYRFPLELVFNRFELEGNLDDFTADIYVSAGANSSLLLKGSASGIKSPEPRRLELDKLQITADGKDLAPVLAEEGLFPDDMAFVPAALGNVDVTGRGTLDGNSLRLTCGVATAAGEVAAQVHGTFVSPDAYDLAGSLATPHPVDLSSLLPSLDLGGVDCSVEAKASQGAGGLAASAEVAVDQVTYRGVAYDNLTARASVENSVVRARVAIDDTFLALKAEGAYSLQPSHKIVELDFDLDRFVPSMLNLSDRFPDVRLSGALDLAFEGPDINHLQGVGSLSNVRWARPDGETFLLRNVLVTSVPDRLTLRSDYVDGEVTGPLEIPALKSEFMDMAAKVFPSVVAGSGLRNRRETLASNDFNFNFTVKETETPAHFFNMPVSVVYPLQISGAFSALSGDLALNVSAPYLRQGNKLIENTALSLSADGGEGTGSLDLTTTMPTKNGPMKLLMQTAGASDRLETGFSWKIDRERSYEGKVDAAAAFSRNESDDLVTNVELQKSFLTFNDSTWTVNPAIIEAVGGRNITVKGVNIYRANQYVKMEGRVSDSPWDLLTLNLRNFSLDYLFESLGIDKVMLGGDATGTFYASRLLSPEPILETPGLDVKSISYNKVVLGDAKVKSRWEPEERGITLDATIDSDEDRRSLVKGAIYPMNDSLDLTFIVDRAKVGFLQPYMEAFASDISGFASGRARIWGNFKYIDLEGDVFADNLKLKVNFTNTYYSATDSVHFSPGLIDLNGISIHDSEGHTARLNGWVRHTFFKQPRFDFSITDARDFLSYNTTARDNPVWYGKIYGGGSVFVKGEPGMVNIAVDMSTAPRSVFTFVLSDQEVADEFSFLTFRDKNSAGTEISETMSLQRDASMDLVNRLREMARNHDEDTPSDYEISLQMRVTPEAQLNLIMDPVGGDRIRANGSGHLRLDYGSANNDLRMYGTYTLDRGSYNFTLQDIIIKDFTIKPGSRITFNGDPYNAGLDIQAAYALNANLSDLDESFLQDKDLNRTNVPVHAILKVAGDLVSPDISFDLEFPTLTTDIYRKVRSIISTDDMMNRQIIYLLALSRFYTPDYMTSTTKGNELVSVASSTISSQLSNLLGSISDNWNIAPTFRSDRGDFSDVEVDVALSSRLLNNRLLFNGNFGYRDNALNTSQFVGDFDLEYLLDRPGMWRLKAYNRYNDQNYYLRTAPTTQGVGVVLKRDFDSFSSFLRPLFRRSKSSPSPAAPASSADSVPSVPTPAARVKAVPRR